MALLCVCQSYKSPQMPLLLFFFNFIFQSKKVQISKTCIVHVRGVFCFLHVFLHKHNKS